MKFSIVFITALVGQALAVPSPDFDDSNSISARSNIFEKRSCVKTPGRFCSKGSCYSDCGAVSGGHKWCWLKWTKGKGDWAKCSSNADCRTDNAYTNMKCALGNCKSCGCSC